MIDFFPLSRQLKVPIILDPANVFLCFLFCDAKLSFYPYSFSLTEKRRRAFRHFL